MNTWENFLIPGSDIDWATRHGPEPIKTLDRIIRLLLQSWRQTLVEFSDPSPAKTKFSWWREEIEALFASCARHPLTQALQNNWEDPSPNIRALIEASLAYHLRCVDPILLVTEADLRHHSHQIAATREWLLLSLHGAPLDPECFKWTQTLAEATERIEILRRFRDDRQRGRIWFPREFLQKFNLGPESLLEDPVPNSLTPFLKNFAQESLLQLQSAIADCPLPWKSRARSSLIMAELQSAELKEMIRDGVLILKHRIELTPFRRYWIARRTRRAIDSTV